MATTMIGDEQVRHLHRPRCLFREWKWTRKYDRMVCDSCGLKQSDAIPWGSYIPRRLLDLIDHR